MQRKLRIVAVFLISSLFLIGCGGGGSSAGSPTPTPTPAPVAVSVSPTSGSVQVAHTLQFTANITGTANQTVTWAVNGTTGGNAGLGTITSSGLYTAPTSVPTPSTVTVTATSAADSTKAGSAGVQIVPPPSPAGTWSRGAPFGGLIGNLTVDPRGTNVVYATAFNSGVFKSTDSGQSWKALFSPTQSSINNSEPSSIAVGSVSSTLYFVTGVPPNPMSLYTSSDGGFTVTKQSIPAGTPGPGLTTDPKNDSTLYIYGQAGISKSADGGASWAALSAAPQNVNVVRVDLQNSAVLYAGTTSGIFKSADSGTTWTATSSGIDPAFLNISDIAADPTNSARIFVGANSATQGLIYVTTDSGATWTQTTGTSWPGRTVNQLQLSAVDANTIYAAVDPFVATASGLAPAQAIYKSSDGGATWQAAVTGLPLGQRLNRRGFLLASNAPDVLLYGSTPELFRSADGATSWTESDSGIYGLGMQALAFDSATQAVYAGAVNAGELWKSADLGASWTKLLNDAVFAVAVDPANPLHLLASNFQQFMLQSTDGGSTWQQVSTPIAIIQSIAFSPTQSGLVLACSPNGGIARSTDNGSTWTISNSGLQTTACRKIAFAGSGVILAATPSGLYTSSDGGMSWTLKKAPSDAFGFLTAVVDPTNPLVMFAADGNFYMKSTDGGNTWSTLNPGFIGTSTPAIAIDPLAHNTIYISSFASNVAVSTDGGLTWAAVSNGLGFARVQNLIIIPGTTKLFAATFNNGVLVFQ